MKKDAPVTLGENMGSAVKRVSAWAVITRKGEEIIGDEPAIFWHFGNAADATRGALRWYKIVPCTILYSLPSVTQITTKRKGRL